MTFSQSGRRIIPSSFINDGKYNCQKHKLLTIIRVLLEKYELAFFLRNALPHRKVHKCKLINANATPIAK